VTSKSPKLTLPLRMVLWVAAFLVVAIAAYSFVATSQRRSAHAITGFEYMKTYSSYSAISNFFGKIIPGDSCYKKGACNYRAEPQIYYGTNMTINELIDYVESMGLSHRNTLLEDKAFWAPGYTRQTLNFACNLNISYFDLRSEVQKNAYEKRNDMTVSTAAVVIIDEDFAKRIADGAIDCNNTLQ
jgi:hypothetical protein